MTTDARTGIVAIGRNEGERFVACLASLPAGVPAVYVDSGSTDESVLRARAAGVMVVELAIPPQFTAARARNEGWRALLKEHPSIAHVQFIDGDCTLESGWMEAGVAALDDDSSLAVVFGRCKERHPEASLYNAQCDDEWNVPPGEAKSSGGNAMMRVGALDAVMGFNDALIAGEEPDLCLRMRAQGWHVRCLPRPMVLHDANIMRFSQWWKRAKRGGHAYAEHVARHGRMADPDWRRQVRSTLIWGGGLPLAVVLLALLWLLCDHAAWFVAGISLALLYPLQWLRLWCRGRNRGEPTDFASANAALLVIAKFPMLVGMAKYWMTGARGGVHRIIEYKAS